MPISKDKKQKVVEELKDELSKASVAILVDYKGLTAEDETNLRSKARNAGVKYRVAKNTLLHLAATQIGYDMIIPYLKESTAIALSYEDPVAPAKVLLDFMNDTKKMSIKVGVLNGTRLITPSEIETLAKLPPKEVLVARLMGQLNAPVSGLVNVLQGTIRKLIYALNAIKDVQEKSA